MVFASYAWRNSKKIWRNLNLKRRFAMKPAKGNAMTAENVKSLIGRIDFLENALASQTDWDGSEKMCASLELRKLQMIYLLYS
jgi:hypothetical protein